MVGRIVIDNVRPRTPDGYPAKATIGLPTRVSAEIFRDGHDLLAARVRWRPAGVAEWRVLPLAPEPNDVWSAVLVPSAIGDHELVVEAWTDRVATWRHDIEVKAAAGQDVDLEREEGARLLEAVAERLGSGDLRRAALDAAAAARDGLVDPLATAPELLDALAVTPDPHDLTVSGVVPLWVDRERAQFGAWYELFPRSEGGFKGTIERLPAIAAMGFDVLYLPPIHPIGRAHRKGRNNTLHPGPDDPGSPWAIGGEEGGHTDVNPDLGTIDDFDRLVEAAGRHGIEVSLDYALQCSPDHPWVRDHPEWFHRRPDGTIKYAENPPKKYQDIYPINFWPDDDADRVALWQTCRDVIEHWIGHGVRIFRVDNPHTKPLAFWQWVIADVRSRHPDAVFLAEAFTRPKMMSKLAEVGFSQSYTYFTWRTERDELREYVEELTASPTADWMRPNFWPNTPDILSGPLRDGPPSAFRLRALLAALLVPSWGMYSGYELCENEPFSDTNEEYRNSEKYEIKDRDWDRPDSIAPFIAALNAVRRRHHACYAPLTNVRFHGSQNPNVLVWSKQAPPSTAVEDLMIHVANLDPRHVQEDTIWLDLASLGLPWDVELVVDDELTGESYVWRGAHQYVRLDPARQPGHVLHARRTAGA